MTTDGTKLFAQHGRAVEILGASALNPVPLRFDINNSKAGRCLMPGASCDLTFFQTETLPSAGLGTNESAKPGAGEGRPNLIC
jgi:hypothetical protein